MIKNKLVHVKFFYGVMERYIKNRKLVPHIAVFLFASLYRSKILGVFLKQTSY